MKKTYTITFKAELTEDDIRAMNKCFFDAMNEAMDIHELWGLEITADKFKAEPDNSFYHIHDCVDALRNCENIDEVNNLLDNFPRKFGEWWVDVVGEGEDAYYEVTNEYWDEQYEELCSNQYQLDIEIEEDEE
jgi:hypothetical protein